MSHWRRRLSLVLRDPWFWGLIVVMAFLGASLAQWLPKPWSHWAPLAVVFAAITIFSTVRGQRYRGQKLGPAQRGSRRVRMFRGRLPPGQSLARGAADVGFDGGSMKVPPGRGRRYVTPIRFMAEAGIDAVLWGDSDQGLEDELALPDDLRQRMKQWRREYAEHDSGVSSPWTGQEYRAHDRTGYERSRELQEVLGPAYRVDYVFTTPEIRAEVTAQTERDCES